MRKAAFIFIAGASAISITATTLQSRTTINGIPVATINQNGKSFVAIEDLKNAGAEVQTTSTTTSIRFKPNPGSVQLDAIQGTTDEWLTNGLVRLKFSNPRTTSRGYEIDLELSNLTKEKLNPVINLGMQFPELYDSEGNPTPRTAANNGDFSSKIGASLTQAATGKATLVYANPKSGKADRIIVRFNTDNTARQNNIKRLGGFMEPGPNFRIFLNPEE